ncbi:unnamed protein product [Durusdinium trenchii]|uniref:Lon N-terminal domain-containing protein n=1 Tax=Durusdinium trenchii TaxID=1381693 RepID=A0ABP0RA17_9DINO
MGVGSRSFSGRPALSLALALFFLGAPLFGLGFLGTSPNSGPARHGASHRGTSRIQRAAVEWLEPLDPNLKELDASGDEDSLVLPVFPLGGPFMPYSNPRLNIFEPRYRALYNDILLSGSRRFVVTSADPESQAEVRLAQAGVVFYLDDLKEVSEMTQDQVKYVCDHKVIGRVRIKRVLNPSSWFDRSTYLRAETVAIEDEDPEEDCWQLEGQVMDLMRKLEPLYKDELQKPYWRSEVLNQMNSSRAEQNGLWSLAELWVKLLDAQLQNAQQEERKMQDIVRPYAKSETVRIEDLPESARSQIGMLRDDFQEQYRGQIRRQLEFAQEMIQRNSHQNRLEYFKDILDEEFRTSLAKKSLKNLAGPDA